MKLLIKGERTVFSVPRTAARGLLLIALAVLVTAAYFLPQILIRGAAADLYCEKIFPVISLLPQAVSGLFIFSLTEAVAVIGSLCLIGIFITILIRGAAILIKQDLKHFLHYLYVVLRKILVIALILALSFELMHGINYNRTGVIKRMHLYGEERPYEDYEQTLMWAYAGMVNARMRLGEDYNGVAHMSDGFGSVVYEANAGVDMISAAYDLGLSPNFIHAKGVMLSHAWRYTDIVGVYDPFLGEANINTDYIDILHFPMTVCHEIVHAKGYASETDANTIAVLSCINSKRDDFKYAGYYYIFMRLWGTVADYAEHEGVTMTDYASRPDFQPVLRDMTAYNMYCDSFNTGPVADLISRLSEDVNDTFLESNGQAGGTDTYTVPRDTYVEYFCRYIRADA